MPENWHDTPLKDLVDPARKITYGIVQPGEWQEKGTGVALIRGQDYSSGEVNTEELRYVHPTVAAAYTRSTVKPGDILISIVGYVGLCAEVPLDADGANITQTTARVVPRSGIFGRFLLHYFRSNDFRKEIKKYTKGSAQPGLNLADVEKMIVRYPHYEPEQQTIAQILDTLDTQIRQTKALIAKLERIKQGLLTDLLTRGIDQNGQLRPTPDQAPHLYKDSPLGWIPREWTVTPVGAALEHVIDFRGRTPKKLGMEWGGGDILALSANNVKMGGIDTSREAYFGSTDLYVRWMTQGDSHEGDVLLTMEAPLGNVAEVPDDKRYILSQRVVLLRFSKDVVLNGFAFWQMQSRDFQERMIQRSTGTTATGIQRAQLVRLELVVPPIAEQEAIDIRLRSVDVRLTREQAEWRKLRDKKNGLMDDLLTGRVRANPLLESEAHDTQQEERTHARTGI